ncbi:MAG: hypothetical protein HC874_14145 [Richelia sp. SL_2_1]|nr:hypothetical protein [Richelia sp. SL_2_1]
MKPTLKISPSILDQWRCYMDGEFNGKVTEQDVINYLEGVKVGNQAVWLGRAVHSMLENTPEKYRMEAYGEVFYFYNEHNFDISLNPLEVEPLIEFCNAYPHLAYEIPDIKRFVNTVLGYEVMYSLRIDAVEPLVLHEFKTSSSWSKPEFEFYERSMQWRLYLMAYPDAKCIKYHIFHFTGSGLKKTCERFDFTFFRSPDIEARVQEYLTSFIQFAEYKGLIDKLILK